MVGWMGVVQKDLSKVFLGYMTQRQRTVSARRDDTIWTTEPRGNLRIRHSGPLGKFYRYPWEQSLGPKGLREGHPNRAE